jgi:hypothetical protein
MVHHTAYLISQMFKIFVLVPQLMLKQSYVVLRLRKMLHGTVKVQVLVGDVFGHVFSPAIVIAASTC